MAIFRGGISAIEIVQYMIAQTAGAFVGSLVIYGVYWQAIDLFEGGSRSVPGTASLFTTFALEYMHPGMSFRRYG